MKMNYIEKVLGKAVVVYAGNDDTNIGLAIKATAEVFAEEYLNHYKFPLAEGAYQKLENSKSCFEFLHAAKQIIARLTDLQPTEVKVTEAEKEKQKLVREWEEQYLNTGMDPKEASGIAQAGAGNWIELSFAQACTDAISAPRSLNDFTAAKSVGKYLGLGEDAPFKNIYEAIYKASR